MGLVFPRDMTDLTRWADPSIKLMRRQELSRRQGGVTQGKDLGPPLWVATWTSVPMRLADADAVMAEFESLQGVVHPFYLHPFTRPQPRETGGQAGALGSVGVSGIRADRAALTLDGLPAGFAMSPGDYLSITTSAGGREFLRLVRGATANGSGITPELEVVPHIRASVSVSDNVALVKPLVEMRLDPDSLNDPKDGHQHRRIEFKATQVVR